MMFRGIIDICSEYDTEHMNAFFVQNIENCYVKAAGTYSNH